jgi:hypothetical protein
MKGEDKIIELLTNMVMKQDEHSALLSQLLAKQDEHSKIIVEHSVLLGEHSKLLTKVVEQMGVHSTQLTSQSRTQERLGDMFGDLIDLTRVTHQRLDSQERVLIEIRDELTEDVPRYDKVIEMEALPDGKRIILHRPRPSLPA